MINSRTIQAVFFLLSIDFLAAGVIPGRWEKVDSQSIGASLTIALKGGERIQCVFLSADAEKLKVLEVGGRERLILKPDVARVKSGQAVRDSFLNGALIGFAVGSGGYLGIHAPLAELQEHDFPAALIFGGIGALAGLAIDAARQKPEALYVARGNKTP